MCGASTSAQTGTPHSVAPYQPASLTAKRFSNSSHIGGTGAHMMSISVLSESSGSGTRLSRIVATAPIMVVKVAL